MIAVALVLAAPAGRSKGPLLEHGLRTLGSLDRVTGVTLVTGSNEPPADALRAAARAADAGRAAVLLHDPWCFAPDPAPFADTLAALRDRDCAAAVAASPATDTLKHAPPPGLIRGTVDRSAMWEPRTPQAYRPGALLAALDRAQAGAVDAALAAGDHGVLPGLVAGPVRLVALSREAVRVEGPHDERAVERLLARRR